MLTLEQYYRKLKGKIMQDQPTLFDPAKYRAWNLQSVLAVAVPLGFDQRQAALTFLATLPEERVKEAIVCRPEPDRGNGPAPEPIKVESRDELFAIAQQAAKQGVAPEKLFPAFRLHVDRRLAADEKNQIAGILQDRAPDLADARRKREWAQYVTTAAADEKRRAEARGEPAPVVGIPAGYNSMAR